MEITKPFLLSEIERLVAERNQASSFVTAAQGATANLLAGAVINATAINKNAKNAAFNK